MIRCPVCRNPLGETDILVWKRHGRHKSIGINLFCVNPRCDYERDIKGRTL